MVRRTLQKTNTELHRPPEIRFRFSRSGGAGGQHVNKVSSRVELLFDVGASGVLSDAQKHILYSRWASRLDDNGVLRLVVDETRSQWKNREIAVERFQELLRQALAPRKKRVATRAHRASHELRLRGKKQRSSIKAARRRPERE